MPFIPLSALPDDERRERADMRGWELRTDRGSSIGRVRDVLLLDGAPALLDVQAGKLLAPRRVLVPLASVRVDAAGESIAVPASLEQRIEALPEWNGDLSSLDANGAPSPAGSDRAVTRVERGEEELHVDTRTTQVGEVVVRKTVDVERVAVPATRTRDDVQVERRPVTDERAHAGTPYRVGDDELHIPIVEEEIVVQTRTVVREVLVVKSRRVQETVEVEADLRRERVHVERVDADPVADEPAR
ncbi:MAG TPA: PRC and DUF2382 domain-containing protein [Gemmatimonadaceae bacterium]|nr:PRC and DUF2382 domain-containing protein [Gemmatimonadaceae bacterium]